MTDPAPKWALMVHGGAKEIQPQREEANRRGCLAALAAGQQILEAGGRALDAAEAVLRVLEDDPTFYELERNDVQTAVATALNHLVCPNTDQTDVGVIALDTRGNVERDHNSSHIAVAYATSKQSLAPSSVLP